jgi:hypothetical protein
MTDIAPHPNPTAPIRKLEADDGTVSYSATCGVYGCNWTKSAPLRTIVEEAKTSHLNQHRARVPEASIEKRETGASARCACEWQSLWYEKDKDARAVLKQHQAERHGVMW